MDYPFTWGDYFMLHVAPWLAMPAFLVIAWLVHLVKAPECQSCARTMQKRADRRQYEAKWYCPFHDERT